MLEKPGAVGRRFAGMLGNGPSGRVAPVVTATPAEMFLGHQGYQTDLTPEEREALRPHPGPMAVPKPAEPDEIERLRQQLREATHEVTTETTRLAALHEARQRAYADRHTAWVALAEAQTALQAAKKYGRQHLVAAYVNQQEITSPTPADCQAELDRRTEQYNLAGEVEQALSDEASRIEFDLSQHRHRRDAALSALVRASPAFLALYERQARLWIELRSLRLCMQAVGFTMGGPGLSRELLSLSQASENVSDRRTGFAVDENMIDTWTGAVRALAKNADALLPGDSFKIDRGNGNLVTKPVITTDSVTDNADTIDQHQVRRDQRAQVGAQPRQRRAGGKRGSSRASRPARNRDPLSMAPQ